ncbi:MAG: hypothetical protein ACLU37_04220 [Collinsella sp.]
MEPSLTWPRGLSLTCPTCGREFYAPSAEDLAFNSGGACPPAAAPVSCARWTKRAWCPTSQRPSTRAVLPWGTLMWDLMKQVAGEMGVRTDVPFNQLSPQERDIVFRMVRRLRNTFSTFPKTARALRRSILPITTPSIP